MRGWRTIYHATGSQKKAGIAILISDKLYFNLKAITRDEEGYYIIITGSIHQEELTIVNVYAPNLVSPKYIKQLFTIISNLTGKNVAIAGDFNTPLTTVDRSSRQRINKETMALGDTLDRYIQNFASKSSRIHILFECTWNILQDRPHTGSQNPQ